MVFTIHLDENKAKTLSAPEEIAGPVAVVIDGTKVRAVWRVRDANQAKQLCAEQLPGELVEVSDLGTWRITPGYIDLHTHGFRGDDITSGTTADIAVMARALLCTGVTSFFPTIASTGKAETVQQIERIAAVAERQADEQAAAIVGIRLEGPFISHVKKGAQYELAIRRPDPVEMRELAAMGQGLVRIVDYAPEEDVDDSLLATLVQLDILPSIGHTAATYEETLHAIDGGVRHSTHLFNGMSWFDHRQPGAAGARLTDPRMTVEIIADGIHLHPAVLKLAVAARGPRDIALITDAVTAAGMPDGTYEFIKRRVQVADGSVRLADGTLAGSVLTVDRAVRNTVALAGTSWSDALRMATKTYTAQLAILAIFAAAWNGNSERMSEFHAMPKALATTLQLNADTMAARVERYCYMDGCVVIGRGYNDATAFSPGDAHRCILP